MESQLPLNITERIKSNAHKTFIEGKKWKLGSSDRNKEKGYIKGAEDEAAKTLVLIDALEQLADYADVAVRKIVKTALDNYGK